ncbi:MAG: hypothetical protein ACI4SA_07920 [Lachnospiraceae bacterium]
MAAVVDEFTYNSFRFECHMFPVEPDNWQKVFAEKALLHTSYLPKETGIMKGSHPYRNILYPSVMFDRIKQYFYKGNQPTQEIYMI